MAASIKKIIGCLDLIILVFYLGFVFNLAYFLPKPPIVDPSTLPRIFLLFMGCLAIGIAAVLLPHHFRKKSGSESKDYAPRTLSYRILFWGTSASLALLAASWTFAFIKYGELLKESPSFAMRFITTSLHPLVPLESRILCTLLPLLILYPLSRQYPSRQRFFFFVLLAIIAFTQLKFGFLFAVVFGAFFLLSPQTFLKKPTLKKYFIWALSLTVFCVAGLQFIRYSSKTVLNLLSYPVMPKLEATQETSNGLAGAAPRCEGYQSGGAPDPNAEEPALKKQKLKLMSRELNQLRTIYLGLLNRTFGLSAEVMRLFVCLRDDGWNPLFRGHQLFRLTGGYVPFYRLAYKAFRPNQGSAVSSAVTNVAVDGYFNGGFAGVMITGLAIGLVWSFLWLLTSLGGIAPLLWYFRIYFLVILTEGSVLSAFVTVVPLLAVVALDFSLKHYLRHSQAAAPAWLTSLSEK